MNSYRYHADDILSECRLTRKNFAANDLEFRLKEFANRLERDFSNDKELTANACATARNRAQEVFRDPARGPYYLARLLAARPDLDGFAGYYEVTNGYAQYCADEADRVKKKLYALRAQLDDLTAAMQKPFSFHRNVENYKQLIMNAVMCELEIKLYDKLKEEVYLPVRSRTGIISALQEMLNKEFLRPTDVISCLGGIAEHNVQRCRDELFKYTSDDSILDMPQEVFDKLRDCIGNCVECGTASISDKDALELADALTAHIVAYPNKWVTNAFTKPYHSKCAATVRELVNGFPPFTEIINRGWRYYMDMAYGPVLTPEKKLAAELIEERLNASGEPMFNLAHNFKWDDFKELCISITMLPSTMGDTLGSLFTNSGKALIVHSDPYTVCSYTTYLALPLWLHADMAKYESCYYEVATAGTHINENPGHKPSYVDYPPLLPPRQWYRENFGTEVYENKRELAYLKALEDMIEQAEELGIIALNESGYYRISVLATHPNEEELERFIDQYRNNGANYSNGEALGGIHLLNAMKKAWGSTVHSVYSARNMHANTRQNLAELMRKQMKLIQILRNELSFAGAAEILLEDTGDTGADTDITPDKGAEDPRVSSTGAGKYAFISYSTKNQAEADAMREFLKKNGVGVWMAPNDIPVGSKYARVINKAIKGCACVVLMLSDYAQSSIWVSREIERAVNYRKSIFSVRLEDIVLNDEFELYISTDQVVAIPKVDENTKEMMQLLASIKNLMGNTP